MNPSNLIKRCRCGYENPESEAFCLQCGQPVLELEPESPSAPAQPASAASPPAHNQKKCPYCGAWNDAYAMLCTGEHCGKPFDPPGISTKTARVDEEAATPPCVAPTDPPVGVSTPPVSTENTLRESRLYLVVGAAQYECQEGDVLGREGTVANQVFNLIKTVSRRHLSISKQNGQWRIATMPGVPNKTLLDGRELPSGGAVLTGDHTLKLSTQCEIKLRVLP